MFSLRASLDGETIFSCGAVLVPGRGDIVAVRGVEYEVAQVEWELGTGNPHEPSSATPQPSVVTIHLRKAWPAWRIRTGPDRGATPATEKP